MLRWAVVRDCSTDPHTGLASRYSSPCPRHRAWPFRVRHTSWCCYHPDSRLDFARNYPHHKDCTRWALRHFRHSRSSFGNQTERGTYLPTVAIRRYHHRPQHCNRDHLRDPVARTFSCRVGVATSECWVSWSYRLHTNNTDRVAPPSLRYYIHKTTPLPSKPYSRTVHDRRIKTRRLRTRYGPRSEWSTTGIRWGDSDTTPCHYYYNRTDCSTGPWATWDRHSAGNPANESCRIRDRYPVSWRWNRQSDCNR